MIGSSCLGYASRNRESDREWPADQGESHSGSRSRSQGGNSRLFYASHVTTEGTDGGISVPHGDGLATGEIGKRGQALVLAGLAGVPSDSGDESAAERSHLRQDQHVGVRRHAA